jgi:hypothetical protein
MKFKTTLAFLFALLVSNAFSQDYSYQKIDNMSSLRDTSQRAPGSVELIRDSRIDSIVQMYVDYTRAQDGFMGYRVQIFFDAGNNSLQKAEAEASQFQMLYPGDTAYISFTQPYYKVRVGDFRSRLEAEGYVRKILPDYPNAFVIKDKIRFPDL